MLIALGCTLQGYNGADDVAVSLMLHNSNSFLPIVLAPNVRQYYHFLNHI